MKTTGNKKQYASPECSVCYIHDKNNGIMNTSIHEKLTDDEQEFHNGAKEFTFDDAVGFDNDFWVVDMAKDSKVDGNVTEYNILIK